MSDVVGSAQIIITPDVSNFSSALQDALAPAFAAAQAQAQTAFQNVSGSADTAAQQTSSAFTTAANDSASIWQQVAIGNIIADGVEAGVGLAVDAIGTLATALPSVGGEIQGAFNTIRAGTGAVGADLDSLKGTFNDLATTRFEGLDKIGDTVTVLHQRLGITDGDLESLGRNVLRLSSLTGTDLNANLQGVTGAFNNFNVSADQQVGKLDELFRIYQKTGAPVTTLESDISSLGATARLAGLSFEDTAALVGKLNQAGLSGQTVTMAFNKILKESADKGVDVKTGFNQVFESIRNGTMSMKDGLDLFGPRAAKVFELVKEGKLDYQDLAKSISSGGDTLSNAADDTKTWQGQLGILVNTLKIDLEPVATFVFGAITSAVINVRPLIEDLGHTVLDFLAPAFQFLALQGLKVWNFLGDVRNALSAVIETIKGGGNVFDGIRVFFESMGNAELGSTLADWFGTLTDAASQLWDILTKIGGFIKDNFVPILASVGAVIATLGIAGLVSTLAPVVGAFIALGSAIAGAFGTLGAGGGLGVIIAALGGPITLVVGAIAALAAGVAFAYVKFDGFRNLINGIADWLSNTFTTALSAVQDLWNGIWPSLESGAKTIADVWNNNLGPALSGLFTSLQPVITWVTDHWQILIAVLMPIIPIIAELVQHWDTVKNVIIDVVSALQPFINIFLQLAGGVISDVINEISGFIDIIVGIFSWDWDKVRDGIVKAASAVLDIFANIGTALGGFVANLGPMIWQGLQALGPIFLNFLTNIPQWLGDLGAIFLDWIENAGSFLLNQGPVIFQNLLSLFGDLLTNIPQWLGDLGAILVGWLSSAWDFVANNWQQILQTFVTGLLAIPGIIVQGLFALGGLLVDAIKGAWDWVVSNGPGILETVAGWVQSLPSTIVGWLLNLGSFLFDAVKAGFQWVVDNGPGILSAVSDWFKSLPGKFLDLMFDLGSDFVKGLTAAWQWVVDNGPSILATVLDWFKGLPGKFVSAIGDVAGTLKDVGGNLISGLWEGVKSTFKSILDGLGAIASPLVNAFKDAFGIKSPSTLMMPVGEMIGQGILVGMSGALGGIGGVAQNAADAAKKIQMSAYHPFESAAADAITTQAARASGLGDFYDYRQHMAELGLADVGGKTYTAAEAASLGMNGGALGGAPGGALVGGDVIINLAPGQTADQGQQAADAFQSRLGLKAAIRVAPSSRG